MTGKFTDPPISVAQNHPAALRMLAAQARLYSDVKYALLWRLGVLFVIGVAVSAVSLILDSPGMVGSLGGFALLFLNAFLMYRERRRAALAVSIQESFDCYVFDLEWNDVVVRQRPSGQQIAQAAERYTGTRTRDWYPDTGQLQRPLDIVVCQQSNVGWGAPVHRAWAWTVLGVTAGTWLCIVVGWLVSDLGAWRGFGALVAPFLPLTWEASQIIRHNFESAHDKEGSQAHILADWADAISRGKAITESRCRQHQDEIANMRKRNAQVPDWFDRRHRFRNERAMRVTAQDMVAAAAQRGLTEETR